MNITESKYRYITLIVKNKSSLKMLAENVEIKIRYSDRST